MDQPTFTRLLRPLLALSIGLMTTAVQPQPLPEEVVKQRIQNHPCGIKSLQDQFINIFKLTTPDSRGGIDTYISEVQPASPLLYKNPAVPNLRGHIDESDLLDSETYFCEFEATQLSVNPTNNRSTSKTVAYIYVVALDNPETMIWRIVQSRGHAVKLAARRAHDNESKESCHSNNFKTRYESKRNDLIGDSFYSSLNARFGHNFSSWDYEEIFSYEDREAYFEGLAKESMEYHFNNIYAKEFFYPTQSYLCVIELTIAINMTLLTSEDVLTILDNPKKLKSIETSKAYQESVLELSWVFVGAGEYEVFSSSHFTKQQNYPKRMLASVRLR